MVRSIVLIIDELPYPLCRPPQITFRLLFLRVMTF